MPVSAEDTIVAIATAPGAAGVAIVRASGPDAHTLLRATFPAIARLDAIEDRRLVFGRIVDPRTADLVDRGYGVAFRAPHTFTGEDCAEWQVHGSPLVLARLLGVLLAQGARAAEAGEFSRRAFEHGRMDLAQVEALYDLVSARHEAARVHALSHLDGALGRAVEAMRAPMLSLLAEIEARIDFAEDEAPDSGLEAARVEMLGLARRLRALAATAQTGAARVEGLRAAIAGRPNAGKSSLFNGLVGRERAIVHATPGTTRDTLEEGVVVAGVLLVLVDTAGLRDKAGSVERSGIDRARGELDAADLCVWVVDRSSPMAVADRREIAARRPDVIVAAKADLAPYPSTARYLAERGAVEASVRREGGLDALRHALASASRARTGLSDDAVGTSAGLVVVSRARQASALLRAADAIDEARAGLERAVPLEIVAADVRRAADAAAEVAGAFVTEDVLGEIFSRFCVGK